MKPYPEVDATYKYLAGELNRIGIEYIHVVDHSAMGSPVVPAEIKSDIRKLFKNTIILSGGYSLERAEADLQNGNGDLIAFGRPFINNPDLVERFRNEKTLSSDLKFDLFYTPGPNGYTDYPFYKVEAI
jgi:NADH:flavin oxidoreductases, Old Yellow Enzyme family